MDRMLTCARVSVLPAASSIVVAALVASDSVGEREEGNRLRATLGHPDSDHVHLPRPNARCEATSRKTDDKEGEYMLQTAGSLSQDHDTHICCFGWSKSVEL